MQQQDFTRIGERLRKGESPAALRRELEEQGFTPDQAALALSIAAQERPARRLQDWRRYATVPNIVAASVVLLILLWLVLLGFVREPLELSVTDERTPSPAQNVTQNTTQPFITTAAPDQAPVIDEDCTRFPDLLKACTPALCAYTHPFTQERMARRIHGIVDGRCAYAEEMPNGGRMECMLPDETRIAFATFMVDGSGDPIQQALDDETCVISGYE